MNSLKIRVIAAVLDTEKLILYKEDGTTHRIPQGDPRVQTIIDKATPMLMAGQVVEIDLKENEVNPYKDYEEASGTGVRFFRMAKKAFLGLFSKERAAEITVASEVTVQAVTGVLGARKTPAPLPAPAAAALVQEVPSSPANSMFIEPQEPMKCPEIPAAAPKLMSIAQEIIAHAKPASTAGFADVKTAPEETIVAVIGDRVVSDVQQLEKQFAHSVKMGSTKAMDAFMARIGKMASERRHSVEDLLKFLEKGDLPIAEDGSIIIYKILRRVHNKSGTYVDCHTGKVQQRVGSYVCMDPSLVDHDRTQECSNGLHVARRQYLSAFSGDVVVLAKVAPEDVIAVPLYDRNKMRVCGYHILFELPEDAFLKLKRNLPFTDEDSAKKLLGAALSGNHVPKMEEVRITGHLGNGVKITPLLKKTPAPSIKHSEVKAEALSEKNTPQAPVVQPKAVAEQAATARTKSKAELVREMYETFTKARGSKKAAEAAQLIFDFKKAAKKGWSALGITDEEVEKLQTAVKV